MPQKQPDFLENLSQWLARALMKRLGLEEGEARDVARATVEKTRQVWGGLSVYVPKQDKEAARETHSRIYEDWRKDGMSIGLCKKYGLSEQRIRQIVAKHRNERTRLGAS